MNPSQQIIQTLKEAGEPLKSAQISEKTGIDKKEVDKTIKVLLKEEKIHSPKRCFYAAS